MRHRSIRRYAPLVCLFVATAILPARADLLLSGAANDGRAAASTTTESVAAPLPEAGRTFAEPPAESPRVGGCLSPGVGVVLLAVSLAMWAGIIYAVAR